MTEALISPENHHRLVAYYQNVLRPTSSLIPFPLIGWASKKNKEIIAVPYWREGLVFEPDETPEDRLILGLFTGSLHLVDLQPIGWREIAFPKGERSAWAQNTTLGTSDFQLPPRFHRQEFQALNRLAKPIGTHPGIYLIPQERGQKLSRLLTSLSRITATNLGKKFFYLSIPIGSSSQSQFPRNLGFEPLVTEGIESQLAFRIPTQEVSGKPYQLLPQEV